MMKWLLTILVLAVAGCQKQETKFQSVSNYLTGNLEITEGDFFTDDEISQLNFGMSRDEVQAIVGEPGLDTGTAFHWGNSVGRSLVCSFDPQGKLDSISTMNRQGAIEAMRNQTGEMVDQFLDDPEAGSSSNLGTSIP